MVGFLTCVGGLPRIGVNFSMLRLFGSCGGLRSVLIRYLTWDIWLGPSIRYLTYWLYWYFPSYRLFVRELYGVAGGMAIEISDQIRLYVRMQYIKQYTLRDNKEIALSCGGSAPRTPQRLLQEPPCLLRALDTDLYDIVFLCDVSYIWAWDVDFVVFLCAVFYEPWMLILL